MGTLRFFEEVVSFKIRRTFGFADYILLYPVPGGQFFVPRTLFGGRTGDKNTIKMRKQTRQSKKKRK